MRHRKIIIALAKKRPSLFFVTGKLESKIYSIPIKTKESKTITVELYACAMLLVAGATMYYFCNGYLIPINVSDSVTMGLSSDY